MKQDDRYFGMTTMQIGILAGLGAAACLLFAMLGWFVFQRGSGFAPLASQPTPVPQSTSTPFVLPTLTPTATPTPVPYELLIPDGWLQFKTALVELWLPKEFKPGDAKLLQDLTTVSPEMFLTGVTSKTSLYNILVLVAYEPLTANSLDDHLEAQFANARAQIHVAEKKNISVNSMDGIRVVYELRSNNIDMTAVDYAFLDGGTVWSVMYIAQINDFYEMLPTFEKSVKTFRIVR